MLESLAQLINLQDVDVKLMEIEELKGDLPSQVQRLETQIKNFETTMKEKSAKLEELEKEIRSSKSVAEGGKAQGKKYQDQLVLVSTNRAYDALMSEIDTAQQSVGEAELKILEGGEESKKLAEELKADELSLRENQSDLEKQQGELNRMIADTEKQAKRLARERKTLVAAIDKRTLRSYERIRGAREGHAVVEMSRGSCGLCFHAFPKQRQVEIRANAAIITCDSCGVILHHKVMI